MLKYTKNFDVKEESNTYKPKRKLYKSISRLEKYEKAYNEFINKYNNTNKLNKSPKKTIKKETNRLSKYKSPSKPFKNKPNKTSRQYRSPKKIKTSPKKIKTSPKKIKTSPKKKDKKK